MDEQFQYLMFISGAVALVAVAVGYGIKIGCLWIWQKIKGER